MKGLRTLKINGATDKSLKELLTERQGYHTFVATLGTNGNGGDLIDVSNLLEDDRKNNVLENYEKTDIEYKELTEHVDNTRGALCDLDEWIAFDWTRTDSQGYLTGSTYRIYINLAI